MECKSILEFVQHERFSIFGIFCPIVSVLKNFVYNKPYKMSQKGLIDIISGLGAGATTTLVLYPIDTIKTRFQGTFAICKLTNNTQQVEEGNVLVLIQYKEDFQI